MHQREIELQTLTPIWTGGAVTGQMDRVHETGILGSLRWWCEAFVRGAGGWACDPSETPCGVKDGAKVTANSDRQALRAAGLCDVCQIFGATGWRRRFCLEVDGSRLRKEPAPPRGLTAQQREHPKNRDRTWNIGPGHEGNLIIRLYGPFEHTLTIVEGLIAMIVQCGAIGARTQLGYGVVAPVRPIDAKGFANLIGEVLRMQISPQRIRELGYSTLPVFRCFFQYTMKIPDLGATYHPVQELLHTKIDLRDRFRDRTRPESPHVRDRRHRVLGTTQGERKGAMINVSRPYRQPNHAGTFVRIWGWTPPHDRDIVRSIMDNYLEERGRDKTLLFFSKYI